MADHRLAARVDQFVKRLKKEDVMMHGFILSVKGQEKAKAYYAPFREGEVHRMYSVSKTMTGIAVGMLIDEGKLRLDDHIVDYFRDWLPENPSPWLMALTIRDMLRMATCYRCTTYREGVDNNWAKTFFTGKPDHAPGTVFYYDTGCSQVLAKLVVRLSGQQVIDYLNERLFKPLGRQDDMRWLNDPTGCCQGGTGLCMSLRDMHRVAVCLLNGGEGVVPAWFVKEMGKKQIETLMQANEEEQYGYGWQCWRTRAGFAMYGLGGQLAVICPDKKAVLSTIADTRLDPCGVQRIYDAFFEEVYPFIGEEDMEPVSLRLKTQAVPNQKKYALPETPVYYFEEGNQLQLTSLQLKGNRLYYENAVGPCVLRFGQGKNEKICYPGWPVFAMASGGWVAPGVLRVRCFAIDFAPCGFDMLLCFQGDTVTVQARRSYDPLTQGYDGVATGKSKA
ncbi:MAG: beta-lactamase family protein [Clostridia bacterium]|nr:beta-lactamase family protein [Clostridia bacterium]